MMNYNDYILGIIFGILNGISNFSGQLLQKKAINDIPVEERNKDLMKKLIRSPIWITGFILIFVVTSIFVFIAQDLIGAALLPGLTASGFIVLALGSSKILKERLKKEEIISIILLIFSITLIGLSRLSIEGTMDYFYDSSFIFRMVIWNVIFTAFWFSFRYLGKKIKKFRTIGFALGSGFPFILATLWTQPLVIAVVDIFSGKINTPTIAVFIISLGIQIFTNMFGIIHTQYALREGNATIVIPIQQIPQQIAPIIVYYLIYSFTSPGIYSFPFITIGIFLISISGFFLARRQSDLEKIK